MYEIKKKEFWAFLKLYLSAISFLKKYVYVLIMVQSMKSALTLKLTTKRNKFYAELKV